MNKIEELIVLFKHYDGEETSIIFNDTIIWKTNGNLFLARINLFYNG
tara:strand:+ start:2795 stop:2935 length:141 start_codon:yes stop_codon:yes gene_type:complete